MECFPSVTTFGSPVSLYSSDADEQRLHSDSDLTIMAITASDLERALASLSTQGTAKPAPSPLSTPASVPLPSSASPAKKPAAYATNTPTPGTRSGIVTAQNARSEGGAAPSNHGSHPRSEAPPAVTLPPSPSPALPASVMRGRKGEQQAPRPVASARAGGVSRDVPVPYGTSPAVHPETGEPLSRTAKGGANRALWASLPAGRTRIQGIGGDSTPRMRAAMALIAHWSAYAVRTGTIAA